MKRRIARVSAMDGNVVSDVKGIVVAVGCTLFILLSSMTIIGKIYGEGVSKSNLSTDVRNQYIKFRDLISYTYPTPSQPCTTHACLNQIKHCNSQPKDWPAGPAIGEAWSYPSIGRLSKDLPDRKG